MLIHESFWYILRQMTQKHATKYIKVDFQFESDEFHSNDTE